jgi:hypothetical protein
MEMIRKRRLARREWHDDPTELAALLRWLIERGEDPKDVPYFLEKPWKWDTAYGKFQRWRAGEACGGDEDCPWLADECPVHRSL